MYEISPFRRHKRSYGRVYDYPAFDLANFGGFGGMGSVGGYGAWNAGFDNQFYDLPGTVEQATRSHVEAQNEFEKAKEEYEEAKKKFEEAKKRFEECEKKVKDAEQILNLAKHRAGTW